MASLLSSICAWWMALCHQILSLLGIRSDSSQRYQRLNNSQSVSETDLEKNAFGIHDEQQQQQKQPNTNQEKLNYTTTTVHEITPLSSIQQTDVKSTKKESTFLTLIDQARTKVLKKWPKAQLYSAKSGTTRPEGVSTCSELDSMTILFRLVDHGIISMESKSGGDDDEFNEPKFTPGVVLGNKDIDWPPVYSAEEAERVLREEGFDGKFKSLTLRKPGDPSMLRDYYVFDMVEGQDAWIPSDGGIEL